MVIIRSNWSGAVSIGPLNMPVKLGSAVKDNSLDLKQVRKSDGSAIKYVKVAEADGKEVQFSEIGKGYTAPDGSVVVLTADEIKEARGEKPHVANILMFTDADSVPPMSFKKAQWVQPDKGGEKIYALLASSLQRTGKVAVLTFAMRENKEEVAVLRAHDGYLSLETLEWDTDMIRPDFPAPENTASEAEQALTLQLVDQASKKYDHSAQADKSTSAVLKLIESKISTGQVIKPPAAAKTAQAAPVDLMAALTAAVEAQKDSPVPAPRTRGGSRKKENA